MGREDRLVVDPNNEELSEELSSLREGRGKREGGRRKKEEKKMSDGEEKKGDGGQPYYGTFQGVPSYTSQEPVIGFPQPAPPPGAFSSAPPSSYPGYQAVPGQLSLIFPFYYYLIVSNCIMASYVPPISRISFHLLPK